MNKVQRIQTNARKRVARIKRRSKAARATNAIVRKGAQAASNKVPMEMPYVKGVLIGTGLGSELVNVLFDIPWYGQLILGPLEGLGDAAFIKKTGELMP